MPGTETMSSTVTAMDRLYGTYSQDTPDEGLSRSGWTNRTTLNAKHGPVIA